MFGFAALGIALAWTAYQLWVRSSAAPGTPGGERPAPAALSPAAVRATVAHAMVGVPASEQDAVVRRAVACGVEQGDLGKTQWWTAKSFGNALPLLDRMKLMRSAYPFEFWPDFAKRIDCALRGD